MGPARDKKVEELLASMHQFMTMFRQAWEEIAKDTKRFQVLKDMDVPPARTIIDSKMFEPDLKDNDKKPQPMAALKQDDGPDALLDVSLDEAEGDSSAANPAQAKKKKGFFSAFFK